MKSGQGGRHLRRVLEVELLGLEAEALGVAEHVARLDGQQGLVGVGVLAARVVRVAGGHHGQPRVDGQPAQVLVEPGLDVEAGVLDLDVEVVPAEDLRQIVQLLAGARHVVEGEALRHHAGQAARQGDDAVGVALHELMRDSRLAVVALQEARGAELDEVVVALGGGRQEREVVALLPPRALVVVGHHVRLQAHDGRDVALAGRAVQLHGAAHHPVVGERHGGVAHLLHAVQQTRDAARAIQDRVVRVDVQVREGQVFGGGRHEPSG